MRWDFGTQVSYLQKESNSPSVNYLPQKTCIKKGSIYSLTVARLKCAEQALRTQPLEYSEQFAEVELPRFRS